MYIDRLIEQAKKNFHGEYESHPWDFPELKHGEGVLESENELNAYMAAYGKLHKLKMFKALEFLPLSEINGNFEICDWGCGQGIASICLLQNLRGGQANNYPICVQSI